MTYNYQALSYRLKDKILEPFLVEFDSTIEENLVPLSPISCESSPGNKVGVNKLELSHEWSCLLRFL